MTSSENPPMKGKWMDLINESVHTVDDVDIGDIDAVNVDFIVVKRGFVNIHTTIFQSIKLKMGWTRFMVKNGRKGNQVKI
jgi:hypothetical protein